jgi:hypothetical protein
MRLMLTFHCSRFSCHAIGFFIPSSFPTFPTFEEHFGLSAADARSDWKSYWGSDPTAVGFVELATNFQHQQPQE